MESKSSLTQLVHSVQDIGDTATIAVEPPVVEEVIYLSYEESKEEPGGGCGGDASEEKIVEVQLPDGRTVRLQVPRDQNPEALAADIVGTVEGVT